MATVGLNQNVSALQAQRRLGDTTRALEGTMQRLSSGLRITRAADDAAGLAIASSLDADSRIYGQAVRNLNDGISLIDIAEGALNELTNITTRIRELATQSANGVYSIKQRNAFDEEADQLVEEYNRILNTTTFNDITLLNGSAAQISLQGGYGQAAGLAVDLLPQNSTGYAGSGTFGAINSYAAGGGFSRDLSSADLNGDGFLDMVVSTDFGNSAAVLLGNGDGTFKAQFQYATGGRTYQTSIADFNGDGSLDIVASNHSGASLSILLNNGNGTFKAASNIAVAAPFGVNTGDINGDGKMDIIASQYFNSAVSVLLGNGNGTFQAIKSFATGPNSVKNELVDINGDSMLDIVASDGAGNTTFSVLIGNGDGTFRARTSVSVGIIEGMFELDDFNDDGFLDYFSGYTGAARIMFGNGDGTFKTGLSIALPNITGWSGTTGDFNSDGHRDITYNILDPGPNSRQAILFGNGDGTFASPVTTVKFGGQSGAGNPSDAIAADINGDGVDDLTVLDVSGLYQAITDSVHSLRLGKFNLNYKEGALAALPILDRTRINVLDLRGRLGGTSSRINAAVATLSVTRENYIDAKSRITDADVATESATLVRLKILQQAGAAILASASKEPQLAIKLLRDVRE